MDYRDYRCIHCNDICLQYHSTLLRHSRACPGFIRSSDKQRYVCFACCYVSPSSALMSKHLKRHTGEKPYKCLICSYKTSQKDRLDSHIRTHTGEKPYLCPECDFRSTTKQGLHYHGKTKGHNLNITLVEDDDNGLITGDD